MNFNLTKQTKLILLFAFGAALLGGVFYSGYWYWQLRQPTTETQPPAEESEKAYEIINNPDGSHTFICYKFGFEFDYPEGWEFSEERSSTRYSNGWIDLIKKDKQGSVYIAAQAPRNRSKYSALRDRIVDSTGGKESIPTEPNFIVFGVPAFRYEVLNMLQSGNALEIVFENSKHVFKVVIPWEKRDDPEYMEILNSFKLTDKD